MRALSLMPADRHFTGAFLLVAFAFIILEFAYGRLAHHDEMQIRRRRWPPSASRSATSSPRR